MIQFFKRFYLNKTVFIIWVSGLGFLFPLSVLMCAMSGQMTVFSGLVYVVTLMLIVTLIVAHRQHDLILMNGLITAIMITELLRYAFVIGEYIQMGTEMIVANGYMRCLELELICFAFFIEIFITYNHYTLNTKQSNNQTKIIVNQFSLGILSFVFLGIIIINWFANTDPWVLLSNSLLYLCDILLYGAVSCCEATLAVDRIDNTMIGGDPKDIKGALWYLLMLFCGAYGLIIAYLIKGFPDILVYGDIAITAVCLGGLIYYLHRKKEVKKSVIPFGRITIFLISLGAIVALLGFFFQTITQFHSVLQPDAAGDISTLDMEAVESAENCYVFQTGDLYILFPQYRTIDYAFQDRPSMDEDSTLTCFSSASFFLDLEFGFRHENLIGPHARNGIYYDRPSSEDLSAFTFYDGKAHFVLNDPDAAVKLAAEKGGSGFEQFMSIYDGKPMVFISVKLRCYRVLAELNGRVCMIDSVLPTHYDDFIQAVLDLGVKKALYLDMGGKSTFSQYRNNEGKAVNLFGPIPGMFVHSWVTFYK